MKRMGLGVCLAGLVLVILLVGCRSTKEEPTLQPPFPTHTLLPAATPSLTFSQPLAALVNGEPIFLDDYLNQVMQAEQAVISQGGNPNTPEGQNILNQARQRVLEAMIEQEIILQAAAREGVIITDATVDTSVEQSIADAGGQEAFQTWLQANNITAEDYWQSLRAQLVAQAMFQKVTQDVPSVAEQVHARHIALSTKEEALQVLARLQNGEDFGILAQQLSQDTTTRDSGGDLGFFPRGLLLSPEIENVAFSLAPRQISQVVQTQFGQYHIIQVIEREEDRPLPEDVLYRLYENAFERWLAEQVAGAKVQRFVDVQ